jgi:hypothetical protein
MRALARSAILLFLTIFVTAAFGASPSDALWNAAVKTAAQTAGLVPGDAAFVLQLVDDKGAPQETWQIWYRLSASSAGDIVMDVVRAAHNGSDTTQKEKEIQKKRKAPPFSMGDSPFDPLVQDDVEARRLPATQIKAGVTCVAFDFHLKKKDKSVMTGTAWLDERSGAPVEVSYTTQPLPFGLFSMTTTLRYSSAPTGAGLLSEVLLEGVGGLLFIKRSFRSTITLAHYWRRAG